MGKKDKKNKKNDSDEDIVIFSVDTNELIDNKSQMGSTSSLKNINNSNSSLLNYSEKQIDETIDTRHLKCEQSPIPDPKRFQPRSKEREGSSPAISSQLIREASTTSFESRELLPFLINSVPKESLQPLLQIMVTVRFINTAWRRRFMIACKEGIYFYIHHQDTEPSEIEFLSFSILSIYPRTADKSKLCIDVNTTFKNFAVLTVVDEVTLALQKNLDEIFAKDMGSQLYQKFCDIFQIEENKKCYDCGTSEPIYGIIPFGTCVCYLCCAVHREINPFVELLSSYERSESKINLFLENNTKVRIQEPNYFLGNTVDGLYNFICKKYDTGNITYNFGDSIVASLDNIPEPFPLEDIKTLILNMFHIDPIFAEKVKSIIRYN